MVKKTVFFILDQLLGALIHLNFIILILMFLIDDGWCKLCNIWLLLCENRSRSITIPELTLEENIIAAITQDRVIDNNFGKGKLKTKLFVLVDYSY